MPAGRPKRMTAVDVKDFIRTYNSATSIQQVADTLGITVGAVYNRCKRLRSLGVPLQDFRGPRARYSHAFVEELIQLAKETTSGSGQ